MAHLWLRSEVKPFEKRTPLTPDDAEKLLAQNHVITVEASKTRIFPVKEYKSKGCQIVPPGTWEKAPLDAYILGLKNIPANKRSLNHKHIYFAHAFKGQPEAISLLRKFKRGGGTLYDLEFLVDPKGARVAAFGFYAGYVGAIIALHVWCAKYQNKKPPFKIVRDQEEKLIQHLFDQFAHKKRKPSCVIIGYGRCGKGVHALLKKLGIKAIILDRSKTMQKNLSQKILKHDILFNCINTTTPINPFLNLDDLKTNKKLSIIADISCDIGNPLNPLPFCNKHTTFKNPTYRIKHGKVPVDVIAIDNLPTFLPLESSKAFSSQLISHLNNLLNKGDKEQVWHKAKKVFMQKKGLI